MHINLSILPLELTGSFLVNVAVVVLGLGFDTFWFKSHWAYCDVAKRNWMVPGPTFYYSVLCTDYVRRESISWPHRENCKSITKIINRDFVIRLCAPLANRDCNFPCLLMILLAQHWILAHYQRSRCWPALQIYSR